MNEYIKAFADCYTRPSIIYDLNRLKQKLLFIKEAANENNVNVLFAVKSFPVPEVLEYVSPYVNGFEISNTVEYKLLPEGPYPYISVSDPTINLSDLAIYTAQTAKQVFFNLDYFDSEIANNLPFKQCYPNLQFGLRLDHTALGIKSTSYRSGMKHSRFGVALRQVEEHAQSDLICGIHLHNGSEINNIESYLLIANHILNYLEKIDREVAYINFGGGLGSLTDNQILILFMELKNIISKNCKIFFEPGNFFSKDAGYALTKIKNIKQVGIQSYIVTTDISYEANLKWCTPRYHSFCENHSGEFVDVAFYGASCYERDLIQCCKIDLNDFKENIQRDKLIFFSNISGYALAWNHSFNGLPKAETYFCCENS